MCWCLIGDRYLAEVRIQLGTQREAWLHVREGQRGAAADGLSDGAVQSGGSDTHRVHWGREQ